RGFSPRVDSSGWVGSAWRLPSGQLSVQGDRGLDKSQMGERLGEVSQLFAAGADLFGEQAEMVGVGQHLLERQPGLVQPAGPGEGVDVHEGAQREGAFGAL